MKCWHTYPAPVKSPQGSVVPCTGCEGADVLELLLLSGAPKSKSNRSTLLPEFLFTCDCDCDWDTLPEGGVEKVCGKAPPGGGGNFIPPGGGGKNPPELFPFGLGLEVVFSEPTFFVLLDERKVS